MLIWLVSDNKRRHVWVPRCRLLKKFHLGIWTWRVVEQHLAAAKPSNELQAFSTAASGLWEYLRWVCELVPITEHYSCDITHIKTHIGPLMHSPKHCSQHLKRGKDVKFSKRCGHGKYFHMLQIHPTTCTRTTHTRSTLLHEVLSVRIYGSFQFTIYHDEFILIALTKPCWSPNMWNPHKTNKCMHAYTHRCTFVCSILTLSYLLIGKADRRRERQSENTPSNQLSLKN